MRKSLKRLYQILGKTDALSGQRETKPNGGYIASHFATVDHSRRIR